MGAGGEEKVWRGGKHFGSFGQACMFQNSLIKLFKGFSGAVGRTAYHMKVTIESSMYSYPE